PVILLGIGLPGSKVAVGSALNQVRGSQEEPPPPAVLGSVYFQGASFSHLEYGSPKLPRSPPLGASSIEKPGGGPPPQFGPLKPGGRRGSKVDPSSSIEKPGGGPPPHLGGIKPGGRRGSKVDPSAAPPSAGALIAGEVLVGMPGYPTLPLTWSGVPGASGGNMPDVG